MSNQLINISDKIIQCLKNDFDPLFSKIRIYGSIEFPLFVAKDLEKVLNLSDMNLRHKDTFIEGLHYEKHMIDTSKGMRETILLTEMGLYQALFNSNAEIAQKYCNFIVLVMRKLRTEGVVMLENCLDELNYKLKESRAKEEELFEQKLYYSEQLYLLKNEKENLEYEYQNNENIRYVNLLEEYFLKPMYVKCEDDDPTDNDVYKFSTCEFSDICLKVVDPKKQKIKNLEISLSDLKDMIHNQNMVIMSNKKVTG